MGFLDRLKASTSATNQAWKTLSSIDQLDQIDVQSNERPVILFKHSTTCGISAGAKYRLEDAWGDEVKNYDFYYLDLLTYRPISNAIATRYGVRHESPQILVIQNGKAVYNASHQSIDLARIEQAIG